MVPVIRRPLGQIVGHSFIAVFSLNSREKAGAEEKKNAYTTEG